MIFKLAGRQEAILLRVASALARVGRQKEPPIPSDPQKSRGESFLLAFGGDLNGSFVFLPPLCSFVCEVLGGKNFETEK